MYSKLPRPVVEALETTGFKDNFDTSRTSVSEFDTN
jgi:hypothetical protein